MSDFHFLIKTVNPISVVVNNTMRGVRKILNTTIIKSSREITFLWNSPLASIPCLSEHHIFCSYLGSLQKKIKKLQHHGNVSSLHTIPTTVSLLCCSHCPRRIRMAGHSARTHMFSSQISSYLLICCLEK